jgi:hypothetical protein
MSRRQEINFISSEARKVLRQKERDRERVIHGNIKRTFARKKANPRRLQGESEGTPRLNGLNDPAVGQNPETP